MPLVVPAPAVARHLPWFHTLLSAPMVHCWDASSSQVARTAWTPAAGPAARSTHLPPCPVMCPDGPSGCGAGVCDVPPMAMAKT